MQVGSRVTRFVYDGENVAAEFVDEDNDGDIDFKRYYWILPQIDQYVGFVDFDELGEPVYYYYLADQVGSIVAVAEADGDIVCRYDYDAFGNLNPDTSFDNLAHPNRYRFHGREWDEHRGEYHYRYRNYIPEWGQFSGPDMQFAPTEAEGACNYVFCGNDPVDTVDPMGLEAAAILTILGNDGDKVVHANYQEFVRYLQIAYGLSDDSMQRIVKNARIAYVQTKKRNSLLLPKKKPTSPDEQDALVLAALVRMVNDGEAPPITADSNLAAARDAHAELRWSAICQGRNRLSNSVVVDNDIVVDWDQYYTKAQSGGESGKPLNWNALAFANDVIGAKELAKETLKLSANITATAIVAEAQAARPVVWLTNAKGEKFVTNISAEVAKELEGGGSWLMTRSQFAQYVQGRDIIGRLDGQFMTSAKQMNRLIHETGGDPVLLGQRLGRNWMPNVELMRIDVTDPLLFNPRLPNSSMSGANTMFRPGGLTSGGVSEIVTDPLPASQVWSTPLIF